MVAEEYSKHSRVGLGPGHVAVPSEPPPALFERLNHLSSEEKLGTITSLKLTRELNQPDGPPPANTVAGTATLTLGAQASDLGYPSLLQSFNPSECVLHNGGKEIACLLRMILNDQSNMKLSFDTKLDLLLKEVQSLKHMQGPVPQSCSFALSKQASADQLGSQLVTFGLDHAALGDALHINTLQKDGDTRDAIVIEVEKQPFDKQTAPHSDDQHPFAPVLPTSVSRKATQVTHSSSRALQQMCPAEPHALDRDKDRSATNNPEAKASLGETDQHPIYKEQRQGEKQFNRGQSRSMDLQSFHLFRRSRDMTLVQKGSRTGNLAEPAIVFLSSHGLLSSLASYDPANCRRWARVGCSCTEMVFLLTGLYTLNIYNPLRHLVVLYPFLSLLLNMAFLLERIQKVWFAFSNDGVGTALFSDVILATASFLALVAIGSVGLWSKDLWTHNKHALYRLALQRGFLSDWAKGTSIYFGAALLVYLVIVAGRIYVEPQSDFSFKFMFGFSLATLMSCAFTILHFSNGLCKTVRKFSVSYVEHPKFEAVIYNWSVVTAHLRTISSCMQWCLVVLGAFAVVIVLVALVDIKSGHLFTVLPTLILVPGLLLVFLKAGGVTEACSMSSTLVNEFAINGNIQERLLLVQHIDASRAGLRYFGALVSSSSIQRFTYFTIVAAVTIGSKFLSLG